MDDRDRRPVELFSENSKAMLTGARFDAGFLSLVPVTRLPAGIRDRLDLLAALVHGQRIVHVGCADHLPLIDSKIGAGTWLHARLAGSAAKVRGFDIATEAINHLFLRHEVADLHAVDVAASATPLITDERWDLMVLGEIVEHLDDPIGWLSTLRRNYAGSITSLLVTVPNAWSLANFGHLLRSRECINSDHRFWFTPYTLAKVLARAGFTPERCWTVRSAPLARRAILRRSIERMLPLVREVLVMRARFLP